MEEELQKRTEEMKKKQEETKATAAVRKVLQKFRFPQMGTIQALNQELEEALNTNLENCGSQKATVENEVKLARENADAKMKIMQDQIDKIKAKREAEESKRKEQLENCTNLLK